MTFDDELRARMKAAADAAGSQADPAAAAEYLAANAGSGGGIGGAGLKLIAGLGALGLVAGLTVGATVLKPDGATEAAQAAAVDIAPGSLFDCPDGSIVGQLRPGDRVFVVGVDGSGDWSAIRDPRHISRTVWVPDEALLADAGVDTAEVPEVECTEPTIELGVGTAPTSDPIDSSTTSTSSTSTTTSSTSTTSSTTSTSTTSTSTTSTTLAATTTVGPGTTTVAPPPPVTTQAPTTTVAATVPTTTAAPTTTTTQPPDTQKPTIQASAAPLEIYDSSWPECDNESQLTAFASDNVGVTSVTATWSGLAGSPLPLVFSNGAWRGNFGPFGGLNSNYNQLVTITLTARDAAGNSQSTTASVRVYGTCLI